MACYRPIEAWQPLSGGSLVFREIRDSRSITIPCGSCVGCGLERSRQWAVRCMHENQLHASSSFVTLTFRDLNACGASLNYEFFSDFLKRLREHSFRVALRSSGTKARARGTAASAARKRARELSRVRFFACGEYGESTRRPHFHALLFGKDFPDRKEWRKSSAGFQLYRSAELERLWPHGNAEIGDVTFESAAYVARYLVNPQTTIAGRGTDNEVAYWFDRESGEFTVVEREMLQMSKKPGIGAEWFKRYRSEVYPGDGTASVVVNGMKVRPPRYYEQLADKWLDDPHELDIVAHERYKEALLRRDDSTPERLAVRENVARARLSFKKRSLE